MNKFEHVQEGPCTVMSMLNKFEYVWGGSLYSEFQCIMGNGYIAPLPLNRQTRRETAGGKKVTSPLPVQMAAWPDHPAASL